MPRKIGPAATLSSTLRQGKSASLWKTNPTRRSTPVTGFPSRNTSPELGGASPEMSESVVDFPHPVGPTTAQNSPARTIKSTSRMAVSVAPVGVVKLRVACFSSMLAPSAGTATSPPP